MWYCAFALKLISPPVLFTGMLHRFFGLILIALLLFLALSLLSFTPEESSVATVFPRPESVENRCGPVGETCAAAIFDLFGYGGFFLLLPLAFGIVIFLGARPVEQLPLRLCGIALMLCSICTFLSSFLATESFPLIYGPGGQLGAYVKYLLSKHFAETGSLIFTTSLLLGGMVLTCEYSMIRIVLWTFGITPLGQGIVTAIRRRRFAEETGASVEQQPVFVTVPPMPSQVASETEAEPEPMKVVQRNSPATSRTAQAPVFQEITDEEEETESDESTDEPQEESVTIIPPPANLKLHAPDDEDAETTVTKTESVKNESGHSSGTSIFSWWKKDRTQEEPHEETASEDQPGQEEEESEEEHQSYVLPDVSLLTPSKPFNYEVYENTVKRQARLLEKSFSDFGFNIRVVEIQTGPVIAQFEVQLERGLRLNKITGLTDDLAIALKVPSVRIVAPIPGKNTVGVEVPNQDRQIVRLREVIEETAQSADEMHIPIYLGKDVSGAPMLIDLTKLPHLLIAGRTGTGKSVCLNSIIVSILMTRGPEEVRMILIDPKMVELSPYKKIPHLMHPVVTDMKKAEAILGWAVEKMEERYQLLARAGVRQLSEYNNLSEEELYERIEPESDEEWDNIPHSLPYMVIVADEMADLMMTSAKEVETHIIRLAQKSRAVGIHLVLATQKPTVDIITGLIKSNLPARIAFGVASQSDSRVVLDRAGAEKLLGNGDMLFLQPGTSQVMRGQGTYVSDKEIEAIIESVATETPEYAEELVTLKIDDEDDSEEPSKDKDDLYNTAVEFVIREGRGSLSLLQRKYSIGYGRAARLIDRMAEEGVVGPYNGSKSREVTTTLHEWRKRKELEQEMNAQEDESPEPPVRRERPPKKKMRRRERNDNDSLNDSRNDFRHKMKESAKRTASQTPPEEEIEASEDNSDTENEQNSQSREIPPLRGKRIRLEPAANAISKPASLKPREPSRPHFGEFEEPEEQEDFIPIRHGFDSSSHTSKAYRESEDEDVFPKVYRIHENLDEDDEDSEEFDEEQDADANEDEEYEYEYGDEEEYESEYDEEY